ncbi:peptidyl-arginine methylase [Aureococcus anophagefferens]|uniref:Peptidyl-arginine methylase n=1 Tax=Aureococcus anophagefferens TaxID=44056 RepID=A0ABR1FYM2_AURAN
MSQLVDGNDDAETDDTEGSGPSGGTTTPHMYVPPGARAAHCFGEDFEGHFCVPARLQDKSADLVEAVNDFHYAMINDHPRNEFYRDGLLAMLAARLGARKVVAIEASRHMAALARKNIAANGLDGAITVIGGCRRSWTPTRSACGLGAGRVVEVNGTEDGGGDVKPYAADLPDVLDTASLVFAKQYGFRFCSVPSTFLAPPVTVFACDFTRDAPGFVPSETTVDFAPRGQSGARRVVLFWDATVGGPGAAPWELDGGPLTMSTDPRETVDNFARDMHSSSTARTRALSRRFLTRRLGTRAFGARRDDAGRAPMSAGAALRRQV